jgi:tetratricopeptide (TPR) repeat protein
MMKNLNVITHALIAKNISGICLLGLMASLSAGIYFTYIWKSAMDDNHAFRNKSMMSHEIRLADHLHAYSQGYLYEKNGHYVEAAKLFTIAEASENKEVSSKAKFAIANLYFDLAMKLAAQEGGMERQQAIAQIELARDSYKSALRDDPEMYVAKYNLELLDRLSPLKRNQGWTGETDGVTMQPFKKNGTSMMKDNVRRGLP